MATYSGQTPIKGTSRGDPAKVKAWLRAQDVGRPEDADLLVDTYYADAPDFGINADVCVAQFIKEASRREPPHEPGYGVPWIYGCNPVGIGVTSDAEWRVYQFVNGRNGAHAHLMQLSIYVNGVDLPEGYEIDEPYSHADNPPARWYTTIRASPSRVKSARVLSDLDNRWAVPGKDYGADIGRILNRMEAAGLFTGTPNQTDDTPTGDGTGGTEGRPTVALTFGRVPHPGYIDIQAEMKNKPEGVGWDNLGKRNPKFIVLHRMYGTLAGTRSYFASPTVGALTDYGIGVAEIDGAKNAGVIHLYNDPRGYRSGWASGRVSAPYGDGLKVVNKYGINAVNRDGVSFEISGYDGPIDDVAWAEIVKLAAYWCDQMEIPYSSLPLNPHTGINAFIWHQEFTIGTGKECPFSTVMSLTNKLYRDTAAYMRPYQEVGVIKPEPVPTPAPEPTPAPIPAPQYAPPVPIEALVPFADTDADSIAAVITAEGTDFIFVGDRVVATVDTPRLQRANAGARRTGPDIKAGEEFDVDFMFTAKNGKRYYLTSYYTRIRVEDTKRISDTKAGPAVA